MKPLIGLLTGTFLVSSAAAQDFGALDFKYGVQPFEDIDITVYDISKDAAAASLKKPAMVFRTCATGQIFPGPMIGFFSGSPRDIADQTLTIGAKLNRLQDKDPTFKAYILGEDGSVRDLSDRRNVVHYGLQASPVGQKQDSDAFKKSLYQIARTCLPGI